MTTLEQTGGYYTPEKIYRNTFHLEMRQGAENKMYTLRRVPSPLHPAPWHAKEEHLTNLSTDKETAWAKCIEHANKMGMELFDESFDKLRKIVRVADGYVNFGKNDGKHVSELEDSYLIWLAEGSKINVHEDGEYWTKVIACDEVIKHAIAEATKRGLFVEFEGKQISVRTRDYILEQRTGRGYHHTDGDKVELKLIVEKVKSFRSAYGYDQMNYVLSLKDIETGLRYQYIGSIGRYSKGETIHVTATVNHKEYNGDEITYLKNIKDVPTEVFKKYKTFKAGQVIENFDGETFTIVEMPEDLNYGRTLLVDAFGVEKWMYKDYFKKYGWKIVK